jgi:hypothetical protein
MVLYAHAIEEWLAAMSEVKGILGRSTEKRAAADAAKDPVTVPEEEN